MIICIPVGFTADETEIDSVKILVEQIESGKAYSSSPDQLTHKIGQAKKELDAHLESHQNDIEAIILSVRLSIIDKLATPTVISKGKEPPDPKELFISQHLNLDRALKLQPNSAEVHYWKARLYGIQSPTINASGRLEKNSIDLDKAIHFARKAVQLDPQNVIYREALATYLVDRQRRKEALEVLNTAVTKRNPIYILLKDIDTFPVPEGTIFSKEDSQSFGDMQMSRRRITNFPQLRVQAFIMPMAVSKIERFYQKQWPKFKFLGQGPAGPFVQYMRFGASSLRPAASISEVEPGKTDGIAIFVMELRNPTKEQREETPAGHPLPSSLGEVFCYLFYVNHRRIY
jgi:hypothetical protein